MSLNHMSIYQPTLKKYKKQKKQSSRLSPLKIIILGLFFCFLFAGVGFFLFWPGFLIGQLEVKVSEKSTLSEQDLNDFLTRDLSAKFYNFIPSNNIWLFSEKKSQEKLNDAFPQLAEIKIDKKTNFDFHKGNILRIAVSERQSIGIYCPSSYQTIQQEQNNASSTDLVNLPKQELKIENCYYFDKQGVIFREAPLIEGGIVLLVYDFQNPSAKIKDQVLSEETINSIFFLKENLSDFLKNSSIGKNLKIESFEIYPNKDLRVKLNLWRILFDAKSDLKTQLELFQKALQHQIKDPSQILEYMDLRVSNRVYYK